MDLFALYQKKSRVEQGEEIFTSEIAKCCRYILVKHSNLYSLNCIADWHIAVRNGHHTCPDMKKIHVDLLVTKFLLCYLLKILDLLRLLM